MIRFIFVLYIVLFVGCMNSTSVETGPDTLIIEDSSRCNCEHGISISNAYVDTSFTNAYTNAYTFDIHNIGMSDFKHPVVITVAITDISGDVYNIEINTTSLKSHSKETITTYSNIAVTEKRICPLDEACYVSRGRIITKKLELISAESAVDSYYIKLAVPLNIPYISN